MGKSGKKMAISSKQQRDHSSRQTIQKCSICVKSTLILFHLIWFCLSSFFLGPHFYLRYHILIFFSRLSDLFIVPSSPAVALMAIDCAVFVNRWRLHCRRRILNKKKKERRKKSNQIRSNPKKHWQQEKENEQQQKKIN